MKAKILDQFREGSAICYLTSISLSDYINALPVNYQDYEVQRQIVNNAYLDALINTITDKKHIPPIVLVVETNEFEIYGSDLDITTFKILDGLQRTFRLQGIYESIKLLDEEIKSNPSVLEMSKISISKNYRKILEEKNSSTAIFLKLIDFVKGDSNKLLETLYERIQWFEIWIGLSASEEVNKMLVLNAGHKAVKTKHQLELLFRNILPIVQRVEVPDFVLIKDKELSQYKLGKERQPGQFQFSNLITSLLSFSEAKPLTTNIDLIQKSQSDYFDDDVFDVLLKYDFLKAFLTSLVKFDKHLQETFGVAGIQWLGRETSLVGIYAALGNYSKAIPVTAEKAIEIFNTKIVSKVAVLRLDDFEVVRNSQDLAKINFGTVNKRAVYYCITDILNSEEDLVIDWKLYFNREAK
ncbi:hypothetical protein SAMN06265348_1285 [Pedobacter westerhofensis]|uniref:DGQHR domain-containing protein n=1 Tax=Pedobacter westerhofensis TaxID=425512 RepID=A0A521FUL8_9SPHI|nr:hypothetical protein [Pedobacter westerhofensis]SMO99863.1 hypothetical protein SAMN06265348_1285 [Pedobacter westerhofensis]